MKVRCNNAWTTRMLYFTTTVNTNLTYFLPRIITNNVLAWLRFKILSNLFPSKTLTRHVKQIHTFISRTFKMYSFARFTANYAFNLREVGTNIYLLFKTNPFYKLYKNILFRHCFFFFFFHLTSQYVITFVLCTIRKLLFATTEHT